MTTAVDLLAPALEASGMSRRALAQATGSSEAGLSDVWHGKKDVTVGRLDRLLQPLGYTLIAVPGWGKPLQWHTSAIAEHLARGDEANALRQVWQVALELTRADQATRVALAIAKPQSCGDVRFDALLAGTTEHLLAEAGLPIPVWLNARVPLDSEWDVEPVPGLRAEARRVTPEPLAARNVFIDPENFANVH